MCSSDLLITSTHRIPGKAKKITDPQRMGTQQISLNRNAIAIATGHLQHGLDAFVQKEASHSKTAHPHDGTTAIRDIDSMNKPLEGPCHLESMGWVSTSWRHHFSRNGDGSSLEAALQR